MIWQTAAMTEPLMSSNKSKFPRNFQNPELHGPSFCKLPPQRHTVSTHPRTDPSVCMSDGFAFQIPSGNSLLPLAHTDALEEAQNLNSSLIPVSLDPNDPSSCPKRPADPPCLAPAAKRRRGAAQRTDESGLEQAFLSYANSRRMTTFALPTMIPSHSGAPMPVPFEPAHPLAKPMARNSTVVTPPLIHSSNSQTGFDPNTASAPAEHSPSAMTDIVQALLSVARASRPEPRPAEPRPATAEQPVAADQSTQSRRVCEWPGCGRTFKDSSNLKRHLRLHTGERPFVCDIDGCNHSFTTSTNLVVHRRVHTGDKPYVCDFEGCTSAFVDGGSLGKHRRAHTGERPYACNWPGCSKAFGLSGDLAAHRRVHTGEKPFHCDWPGCGKSFAQRSTMKTHRLSHTGDRPYVCTQCQSAFVSSSHLSAHRRSAHANPPPPPPPPPCI